MLKSQISTYKKQEEITITENRETDTQKRWGWDQDLNNECRQIRKVGLYSYAHCGGELRNMLTPGGQGVWTKTIFF